VDRLERIRLYVRFQEGDIFDAGCLGVLAAELQKTIAAVKSKHRPGWADQASKLDGGVTKAAPSINHLVARPHRE